MSLFRILAFFRNKRGFLRGLFPILAFFRNKVANSKFFVGEVERIPPLTGISSGQMPSDIPACGGMATAHPSLTRDSAARPVAACAIPARLRRALQSGIKKAQSIKLVALFCYRFAVREGFEPPVRCRTPVFEAGSFNHSDISPKGLQI